MAQFKISLNKFLNSNVQYWKYAKTNMVSEEI